MLFSFESANPTHGIIYYLFSNHKDVFYNNIIVEATSSSDKFQPRNTIDYTDLYWYGGGQANITYFIP